MSTKRCSKCAASKPATGDYFRIRSDRPGALRPNCKTCEAEYQAAWVAANKSRMRELVAAWRSRPGRVAKPVAPEKRREYARRHYQKHKDRDAEFYRERAAKWSKENPEKGQARKAQRRAQKLKATPAWANQFFIQEAYHLARLRTQITGIQWDVDHIVPLKSPLVCGLHVEHNLAVIPSKANASKGNRFWPNCP